MPDNMITPSEYHKLNILSNSKIKLFRDNKFKFKRWFIDGIEPPSKPTLSTILGNGVDFKLLREDENWDDHFIVYSAKKVTPSFLAYCTELYDISVESLDDLGKVNRSFESMMEEAFNNLAFDSDTGEQIAFKRYKKASDPNFIKAFETNALEYYNLLRSNTGKTTLTLQQFETIEKLTDTLKTHWVTRNLINLRSDKNREVINQFVYVFEYLGLQLKIMVDKLVINHQKKIISIFDLKTCYNQDAFDENFLKYSYYTQGALYTIGIIIWANEVFPGYTVTPMQFLVCPTTFLEAPLFIPLKPVQLEKCKKGFTTDRGKYYKGLDGLLSEIAWIKDKGIWEMNKEDYENKGVRELKIL